MAQEPRNDGRAQAPRQDVINDTTGMEKAQEPVLSGTAPSRDLCLQMTQAQRTSPMRERMRGYEDQVFITPTTIANPQSSFDISQGPVLVKIVGRCFSSLTALKKPCDERFNHVMVETARFLMKESGAYVSHTQSDEITLVFYGKKKQSRMCFDGKLQKVNSALAALASVKLNQLLTLAIPEAIGDRTLTFHAIVFQVPSFAEASNWILSHTLGARRNAAIAVAVAEGLSTEQELKKARTVEVFKLLESKGIRLGDYPKFFRDGTILKKVSHLQTHDAGFEVTRCEPSEEEVFQNQSFVGASLAETVKVLFNHPTELDRSEMAKLDRSAILPTVVKNE